MNKFEAENLFASGDVKNVCDALLAISFYEPDWQWAQDRCLQYLSNSNPTLSGFAATCLGHIARIHGEIDKAKVIPQLRDRQNDPAIAGQIADALDDISQFVK